MFTTSCLAFSPQSSYRVKVKGDVKPEEALMVLGV
jgi:hypothetical protein